MLNKIASDVCRTCLQRNSTISIINDEQLMNKFIDITEIEIENDGLPDKICAECIEKLTFCYDFKKQCKSVENQLQSFVRQIESKFDTFVQIKSSRLKKIEIPKRKIQNTKSKLKVNKIIESRELTEIRGNFEEVIINENAELKNNLEMENTEIENVDIKLEHINFEQMIYENNSMCDNENVVGKQQSIASKLINTDPNENICLICVKTFSRKSNLARHMETHEGKKRFQCDICKQAFTQKISLKCHMSIHSRQYPYYCELCKKGTTRSLDHIRHMQRHLLDLKPSQIQKRNRNVHKKQKLKKEAQ